MPLHDPRFKPVRSFAGSVVITALPLALVMAGTDGLDPVLVIQTAAMESALDVYDEIIIPSPPAPYVRYVITDDIDFPSYVKLTGKGKPKVRKTTGNAQYIQAVGKNDIEISGILWEGNGGVLTSGNFALITNCYNVHVLGCDFEATRGSFVFNGTSEDCSIENFKFSDGISTALECSGSAKRIKIASGRFVDNVGFAVWLTGTTNNCTLYDLSCDSNGLELVGVTYLSHSHMGSVLRARGTGDNGISCTGYNCQWDIIECSGNDKHGFAFYGYRNILTNFHLFNNGQLFPIDGLRYGGIAFTPAFGGIAQHNIAVGGEIYDNQAVKTQYHNVKCNTNGYVLFAAAQVISLVGTFRYFGLNLYVSANTGTTGVTSPVHTSGTVSDGAVNWTFVRAFEVDGGTTTVEALSNVVTNVKLGASIGDSIADLTATDANTIVGV